ncbi:Zinc finger protein [Trichinella papuae]|uniref:Zinc finger protein n=1 Tax=Trichinella papuae TaxID=268474 RepID=A0A0V1MI21_9BILA|nr:Zinc finger protein [Trichinella papuae]KRZ71478.1 Zinc finger protein [Trichinella papuae]
MPSIKRRRCHMVTEDALNDSMRKRVHSTPQGVKFKMPTLRRSVCSSSVSEKTCTADAQSRLLKVKFMVVGCGRQFSSEIQLMDHGNTHSGLKPYACEEHGCQLAFCCRSSLQQHMKTVHLNSLSVVETLKFFYQLPSVNWMLENGENSKGSAFEVGVSSIQQPANIKVSKGQLKTCCDDKPNTAPSQWGLVRKTLSSRCAVV